MIDVTAGSRTQVLNVRTVQRCAGPERVNSIDDFPEKKVSLYRRQVFGDDICINAQTEPCLRIVRHFGLNDDLLDQWSLHCLTPRYQLRLALAPRHQLLAATSANEGQKAARQRGGTGSRLA